MLARQQIDLSDDLDADLNRYFEAVQIESKDMMDDAYRLRYAVYCIEQGFLSAEDYVNGMEKDNYDRHSFHFAVYHKRSGRMAATARLILWNDKGFPMQQQCNFNDGEVLDALSGAEVSRLIIAPEFRRRQNDGPFALDIGDRKFGSKSERRAQKPIILLGLLREIYRTSKQEGICTWYAAMEPRLQRHLKMMSIHYHQIGPITDYYGDVAPYRAYVEDIETRVKYTNPELFKTFQGTRREFPILAAGTDG